MDSTISKLQKKISEDKNMINYDDDTLKYVQKPIGKALFNNGKKVIRKNDPNEKMTCELCGKSYTRCNKVHHNKTQYHQLYEKINKKMMKLVLND
jgi:hypothetical protein